MTGGHPYGPLYFDDSLYEQEPYNPMPEPISFELTSEQRQRALVALLAFPYATSAPPINPATLRTTDDLVAAVEHLSAIATAVYVGTKDTQAELRELQSDLAAVRRVLGTSTAPPEPPVGRIRYGGWTAGQVAVPRDQWLDQLSRETRPEPPVDYGQPLAPAHRAEAAAGDPATPAFLPPAVSHRHHCKHGGGIAEEQHGWVCWDGVKCEAWESRRCPEHRPVEVAPGELSTPDELPTHSHLCAEIGPHSWQCQVADCEGWLGKACPEHRNLVPFERDPNGPRHYVDIPAERARDDDMSTARGFLDDLLALDPYRRDDSMEAEQARDDDAAAAAFDAAQARIDDVASAYPWESADPEERQ